MKRLISSLLCLTLLFSMLALPALADEGAIVLSETTLTLGKGKTAALSAQVPEGVSQKKLVWTSSDPSVATVKGGKVKGVKCGECDIICRASENEALQAVCHVTVIQPVSGLTIKDKKLTVPFGSSVDIAVTVKPADATYQNFDWKSSNTKVCTVDANGRVTAVGAGDCEVTCTAVDGSGKSAKVSIHVPIFGAADGTYTVKEQDGLLIPIDWHGVSLADINHKASGSQSFLYQLTEEGIQIYPLAAGSASITLTSKLDKKDQAVYNVSVASSAVFKPTEEVPIRVILVSDKPAVTLGDKVTFTYQVLGNPVSMGGISWGVSITNGSSAGSYFPPDLKGKTSGSFTVDTAKCDAGAKSVNFHVTAVGEKHRNYKADLSVSVSNGLVVSAVSEAVRAQAGTPFRVLFKVTGGAAPYDVEIVLRSGRAHVKTNGTGEYEIIPESAGKDVSVTVWVTDAKRRKTQPGLSFTIPVSDEAPVLVDLTSVFRKNENGYALKILKGEAPASLFAKYYMGDDRLKLGREGTDTFIAPFSDNGPAIFFGQQLSGGSERFFASVCSAHLE